MTASKAVRESTAIADPNNPANVLVPNAQNAAAVTKSDSTVFSPPAIGLWVGGTGDVAVRMYGSQSTVVFTAVPAGSWLYIQIDQVKSTSTTATNMNIVW